ncbi:MAG: ATP-binding cassette subfamily B multidrug efflux pump [Planctomycetota bacterium]|jgi:ATP-binding cassette subfamily B multidrug efflux pump
MSEKKKSDFTTLKRVVKLAKPHSMSFWVSIFLSLALAIINAVRPIFVKETIDVAINNYEYNKVFLLALSVFGLILLAAVLRYFFIYITRYLGQAVVKDLRVKMFEHVIGLRLSFFDVTPIGTATTRTVNDIETVNNIFTQGLIQIVADLATIIFILIIMFYNSPIMALMSISTLPILIYVSYIFKNKVKITFQKVRTKVSELNAFLQEHITGMKIVQIFGVEKQEFDKYEKINQAHTDANVDTIWYYSLFFPAVEILQSIAVGFMIWMGARYIVGGSLDISVGLLVSYILWINMLFRPIRFLAERFNTVQMGLVAAERVFNLIDNPYVIENEGKIKDVEIKGDIEFKDVSFSYTEDKVILKDLNFTIKKGETLAIVGATGSGKSTIINVLSKLYPINKGEITIDGNNINEYELGFLRSQICTVLQDVFLFSGTIADNIRLLDKTISLEEIKKTAKLIGADIFIEKLPNTYDYEVMERGATLSLGQRQLISFVRALIYKPAILVLDEATSSVDTETEKIVQNAIDKMIVDRTSIIIAHRLSTIENADKIMVLKDGIIVEYGTREELLKQEGQFFELYQNQFNRKIS